MSERIISSYTQLDCEDVFGESRRNPYWESRRQTVAKSPDGAQTESAVGEVNRARTANVFVRPRSVVPEGA